MWWEPSQGRKLDKMSKARYKPVGQRSLTPRATRGLAIVATVFFIYFVHRIFFSTEKLNMIVPEPIWPERYPVRDGDQIHLPRGRPKKLPRIQHEFGIETPDAREKRLARLEEVRDATIHAWTGYKAEAWGRDELRPVTGGFTNPFCGWAATLVDSLDTLYIMGMYEEFGLGLYELAEIDFTKTEGCQINLFETTIRHLGGLLSAFDISGRKHMILIEKAIELGEILFTAFDTPNRMPTPHYYWSSTKDDANSHLPSGSIVVAVLGTLSLEFTRLSQITGNQKYYDGIQRIMNELEKWQDTTNLPGMWPATVDATKVNQNISIGSPFVGRELYTLGALADSAYEYIVKEYILLGGRAPQYRKIYESFIEVAKKHLFYRPMTVGDKDILLCGTTNVEPGGVPVLNAEMQHLTCFVGGMVAMAGKVFHRPEDVEVGRKLADGCVWAYRNTVTGIMPEQFRAVACENKTDCTWDEKKWFSAILESASEEEVREIVASKRLSPGFTAVVDSRYLLRPEAIESVFMLYRITGDQYWADAGWDMFKSIQAHTTTRIAHSAIDDVTKAAPRKTNEMESFWIAETLKYFYLLFSEPSVINLDEYVLNTEAHPLKRPK